MDDNLNATFEATQQAAAAYELKRNARLEREKKEEQERKDTYASFLEEMEGMIAQTDADAEVPTPIAGVEDVSSEKFEELLERYPEAYVYCQSNYWRIEIGNKTYREV